MVGTMASSGSVFSQTLQTITTTKLEEIAGQRMNFENQHAALLAAAGQEQDQLKRLFILVKGAKAALGVQMVHSKTNNGTGGRVLVGATSNSRLETDMK